MDLHQGISPFFADRSKFFITGIYHHLGSSWKNDIENDNSINRLGNKFFDAANGPKTAENLQRALDVKVLRENPFTSLEGVEDVLKTRVYMIAQSPRLLELPQQRDSIAVLSCLDDPRFFKGLRFEFLEDFLGTRWGTSHRNEIGGGFATFERIKEFLPQFAEMLDNYFEEKRKEGISFCRTSKHSLHYNGRSEVIRDIEKIFNNSVTILDAGALLGVLNHSGSDSHTAFRFKVDWEKYAPYFDGLSFTDILIGSDTRLWRTTQLSGEFARANAAFVGTTEDLVRQGDIAWPKNKTIFNWKPRWYRRCASDPQEFKDGVKSIRDRVMGTVYTSGNNDQKPKAP